MNRGVIAACVLAFLCLAVFASTDNEGPTGKKVLAILDESSIKHTHSLFFKSLEESGYKIDYVAADAKANLRKYGEWQYDHLILFAPSADDLAGVKPETVLEFIDEGHNVILAASSDISDTIRKIASECNVEFDESSTFVVDHFSFDKSDYHGPHNLIVADQFVDSPVILGKGVEAPVLFRGVAQDIIEDSPLVFSVLSASSTAYSHVLDKQVNEVHVAGKKTSLVSVMQARNNARVLFSGSLDLFSNKFFVAPVQKQGTDKSYEKSGNEYFAKQVALWTFQEKGILRASAVRHHLAGANESSATYTIKDDLEYSIKIEEWNGRRWVPYLADDVQLEFIMLDPHIRTTLVHNDKGVYSTKFVIPDVYGVYTFKIEYIRKGYGFLNSITRVPVRPFRHTQYERFIDSAYPYYASAFSMLVGLFMFSWFFLYSREK